MEIIKVKNSRQSRGPMTRDSCRRSSIESGQNLEEAEKKALRYLKAGKVIICPTDTVYGLLADATNRKAVKKLFEIKKRPKEKAIPIFVKDIEMAKKLAFIDKKQEKFLKNHWPGKTTAVLKRKGKLPEILFGKTETIGLRIPNYKLVNLLLEKLNKPLTGTSANISGKPASTRIKEILKQFAAKGEPRPDGRENHPIPKIRSGARPPKSGLGQKYQPDLVINAGNLPKNKPSRIVDLTGEEVKVLRP